MTAADQDGYGANQAVAQLKQAEHDARITYLTICDQAQRRYQAASQTAWDTYQLTEMQAWDSYVRAVNTARGTYRDLPPAAAAPPPRTRPGSNPYPVSDESYLSVLNPPDQPVHDPCPPAGADWPPPPAGPPPAVEIPVYPADHRTDERARMPRGPSFTPRQDL